VIHVFLPGIGLVYLIGRWISGQTYTCSNPSSFVIASNPSETLPRKLRASSQYKPFLLKNRITVVSEADLVFDAPAGIVEMVSPVNTGAPYRSQGSWLRPLDVIDGESGTCLNRISRVAAS
jgi:hypothetical protein